MREGWVRVFSANELLQAKLAEDVLKQNGIESHIVSKPDSVLPSLGEAELFTQPENVEAALHILKENEFLID